MPLPELIPVRYTEEDAGYVTVRPVVKQSFRLVELADMVIRITGKDTARVQQIFRAGSVVYNGYRYWWEGFPAEIAEIAGVLAAFPGDEASRAFDAAAVTAVLFEMGGGTQRTIVEITRREASARRFLRHRSPWYALLDAARQFSPRYEKYSHGRRADLFRATLPYDAAQHLLTAMLEAAPRGLRQRWSALHPPAALTFVCPRK
jgi:hypothetical protein